MSTDDTKLIFGSTEWIEALHQTMRSASGASGRTGDAIFSMSETYTDVPPDIAPDGVAGWTVRLADGEIAFAPTPSPEVEVQIIGDYHVIRDIARIVVDGDPEQQAKIDAIVAAAAGDGKFSIVGDPGTPPEAFAPVHDDMARITA